MPRISCWSTFAKACAEPVVRAQGGNQAEAHGAANPCPRPPARAPPPPSPLRGSARGAAEGAPPPRPETHQGDLRAPRNRLPPGGSESAEARGDATARGTAQSGGIGSCDPGLPTWPERPKGPELRGQSERLRPLRVGETGFEPATPWSR